MVETFSYFLPPTCHIYNLYGPTETTITATYHPANIMDHNQNSIPIGRPFPNYQCHIVDNFQQIVAMGQTGELFISGHCIFQGYLNRPDLTEQVTSASLSDTYGGKYCYHTGDLCRMDKQGIIHFIGRKDFQVKIRGQRLEIGEIEQIIFNSSLHITNCIIMKYEEEYLLAYVEIMENIHDETMIKDYCQKHLPKYMIPSFFILMKKFPLNQNGKVDRKQLPKPDLIQLLSIKERQQEYMKPETDIEKCLYQIYLEALSLPADSKLNMNANFIELGGTSLSIMKVLSLIRQRLYCQMDVTLLFSNSSIYQLSKIMESLILEQQQSSSTNKQINLNEIPEKKKHKHPSPSLILETLGIILLIYHYFMSIYASTKLISYIGLFSSSYVFFIILYYVIMIPCIQLYSYLIWKHLLFPWGMKTGAQEFYSWTYYRWWFLNQLWKLNSQWLYCLLGTPIYNIYLRLCGSRIGRNVHIYTTLIDAPDLVDIKDSIFIGYDVIFNSLMFEHTSVVLKKIKIESNCSIGCCSVLYNGVQMDTHVLVRSMSSVTGNIPSKTIIDGTNYVQQQDKIDDMEGKMNLNLYKYCYQIMSIFGVICLHSVSIYIPYLIYNSTILFLLPYWVSLPLCWMSYLSVCITITLFSIKYIVGIRISSGQYALNSWYILHCVWLRHLLVSNFGHSFQRLFDTFHPIYSHLLRWLGVKIDDQINMDIKIADFSLFLYYPSNLLTINNQLTTFSQVRFVPYDVNCYGQCYVDQIYIGSQSTFGNNSTIHPGSNVPSLTMIGAMTRLNSSTKLIVNNQEQSLIVFGIPAQQMPFRFTSIVDADKNISNAIIYRPSIRTVLWPLFVGFIIVSMSLICWSIAQNNLLLSFICFMFMYSFVLCFIHCLFVKYPKLKEILWLQRLNYYLLFNYYQCIGQFISGTQWFVFMLRGLRAKIGRDVIITDTCNIPDPQLTVINDYVKIGYGAVIQVSSDVLIFFNELMNHYFFCCVANF
ncbi:unnamed protein product [Rotaria magnacalcarata]|nr:unnamed protein product [Rotaria magnacalcarata]CAF2047966.1 unnamed protein product [Rotaria magnacalcarata]